VKAGPVTRSMTRAGQTATASPFPRLFPPRPAAPRDHIVVQGGGEEREKGGAAEDGPRKEPGDCRLRRRWCSEKSRGDGKVATIATGRNQGPRRGPDPPGTKTEKAAEDRGRSNSVEEERAETMRLARARVNLNELSIKDMRPRRARTGALLLEIPGAEGARLADVLAEKLRVALAEKQGVKITRPQKTAEIRLRDLEDSVSTTEIAGSLAERGGCHPSEIQVDSIKGAINGLGSAWARCPLAAANNIVREGANQDRMDPRARGAAARAVPPVLQMLGEGTREGGVP